jgi:hypothetical protein
LHHVIILSFDIGLRLLKRFANVLFEIRRKVL